MKKRLLALFISVLMLAGIMIVPTAAMAEPIVNLAPEANVEVSYCTTWNSASALNDGKTFSGTGVSDQLDAWGTWVSGGREGPETITYTWSSPATFSAIAIQWFSDAQTGDSSPGVRVPKEVKLYYDNNGVKTPVPGFTSIGLDREALNTANFDQITTNTLTLELYPDPESYGMGIREYQVLADPSVFNDDQLVNRVANGINLEGIDAVTADLVLPTENDLGCKVEWSSNKPEYISNDGKVTLPEEIDVQVELTVTITKGEAKTSKTFDCTVIAPVITAVPSVIINFSPDKIPELPTEVDVVIGNGHFPNEKRAVTWDDVDISAIQPFETVTVAGIVEGTSIPASAIIKNLGETPIPDVAWYKFDEAEGETEFVNSVEGSKYGNAVAKSSATIVEGLYGNGIQTNSTRTNNGYVELPEGIVSELEEMTITSWVYQYQLRSYARLFDFGSNTTRNMWFAPQNTIFALTVGGSGAEQRISVTNRFVTNRWAFVAITIEKQDDGLYTYRYYKDGILLGEMKDNSLCPSAMGSTTRNWIGRSQYSDAYLRAIVDDFRIYSRALNVDEVRNVGGEKLVIPAINEVPACDPVYTKVGEEPVLPVTVRTNYNDGSYATAPVVWDEYDKSLLEQAGSFIIEGTVPETTLKASVEVNVIVPTITEIKTIDINVEPGFVPNITKTVTAVYNDGMLPDEQVAVTWEDIDPSLYENEGAFTIQGDVEGTDIKAVANINVRNVAKAVSFEKVKVTDEFWSVLQKRNIITTIKVGVENVEKTGGGFNNFINVAKMYAGEEYSKTVEGTMVFQDSDVHKMLEAMCISMEIDPMGDPEIIEGQEWILNKINEWIPWLEGAQAPDGYFNAWYTLSGRTRWSNFSDHEFYVAGHFFEAAVAHYRMTKGQDDRVLNIAIKLADYLDREFGPYPKRNVVPGHEEVELGLVKLANLMDEINGAGAGDRYWKLAKFFTDMRGDYEDRDSNYRGGTYSQDNVKLVDANDAVGHSVRFGYFVSGATDIALINDDPDYKAALLRLWDSAVNRKMYVTGAWGTVGNGSDSEGFGPDYYLPSNNTYAETCATISNAMWEQRMNLLFNEGKYIDVMETALYNGVLASADIGGTKFYYTNYIDSSNTPDRSGWFGCACCPPNLMRTVSGIGGYMYATKASEVYANMYIDSHATFDVDGQAITVTQKTRYPYEGNVLFTIDPSVENKVMQFKVRIPEWQTGFTMKLNGKTIENPEIVDGYVTFDRAWNIGDTIELDLKMDVQRYYTNENVDSTRGKVALTRGPIVFSLEKFDNPVGSTNEYRLDPRAELIAKEMDVEGIGHTIVVQGMAHIGTDEDYTTTRFTAIPNYLHRNRGATRLTTFLIEGTRDEAPINTSIVAENENYLVNAPIKITVTTPDDIWNIALVNEYGKDMGKTFDDVVYNDDGTMTWTLTTSIGTKGNREIKLMACTEDEIMFDTGASLKVNIFKDFLPDEGEAYISSINMPRVGFVNEPFEVKVITSTSVAEIAVANEYGNDMGKADLQISDSGSERTWTFKLSVGSKGDRHFTIKGKDAYGNWISSDPQRITIIKK